MNSKPLERFFAVVSFDRINDSLNDVVAEQEENRNKIRKDALSEMDKLNPVENGESIQQILIKMNKELTLSYEKELFLRDFINKFK